MDKKIQVTWVRSAIGRPEIQKKTIKALGFTKLNQTKEFKDEPVVRGMINAVSHLVKVVEL